MSIHRASHLNGSHLTIVNVSSLAALVPYDSWSIYCAGKAAREMFHRVLASENVKDSCLSIMNYAPGPLDTDMSKEIRESSTLHAEARDYFKSLKDKNEVVQVAESAGKLVSLVLTQNFKNGSHVDYYDEIGQPETLEDKNLKPTKGNPRTDVTNEVQCPCSVAKARAKKAAAGGECDSCGCSAACGPQCQCSVSKANAKKAAAGGECDSCGCSAACGPQCQCSVSKASAKKAAAGGECDSCGCSAACGPQCECPVGKAAKKAAAGGVCDSCGCSAACGPQCECPVGKAAKKAAAGGECDSCGCSAACGPQCECPVGKAIATMA